MPDKKKKKPVDVVAEEGSFAGGLRKRREALDEGDITEPEGNPAKAFEQGIKQEKVRKDALDALAREREKEEAKTAAERRKKEYGR